MTTSERLRALESALRSLPLHSFVERLPALLDECARLAEARVRLVDYPAANLVDIDGGDMVAITGTLPGAAYREQQAVVETDGTVHLPLLSRGNCHGVLTGRVEGDPDRARLGALGEVACALADALQVADTGTDQLARARRDRRMTVAAEMQWELLPGRGLACPELTLAGQLEPAYAVRGDNFDWSLDPGRLTLGVTNGMGEGLNAALLTSIAITAIRNARRSGHGLAEAAVLADQVVWGQYGGEQSVAALLLSLDLANGAVQIVDAGSPQLWRVRGDTAEQIGLEVQVPLGALEETQYRVQHDSLRPGDRLLIVSDGVYASENGDRAYSDVALPRTIRTTRALPPAQVVRAVLSDLAVFRDHRDLDDDAVVVCLDWHGPAR
ncbi:PP2C family protein-serine/threonine phosphatase [Actinokineospora iranica]|uniref:Stage II sporulation protein E (SpoIIE) n=1 Tax=Actinokineospora iranica TaxID=1271860 RepID=A0A1G6KHR1_9PSEU|nr:PP2C family protein-serine/threonine phosphatase [Actinokineospora iranica]SDC30105.1 Stage II sporulation protein E (SpoIIE) [Actinokineospora iranica]